MATPHLCKTDLKSGSGKTRYPLIADGSHLLIVRKNTAWTGKELIVTPDQENYTCASAYASASSWNASLGSDITSDGIALAGHYNSIWDAKTVYSWTAGHRPLFQYYARSNAPYAIRTKRDLTQTDLQKLYEYGGSRLALHFNCFALPVGNCTSFDAYLRFWNPSWIWIGPLMQSGSSITQGKCYDNSHNNTGTVRYHFDSELSRPSAFENENYGSCAFPAIANQGHNNSSGNIQYANVFDVWGSHLQVASSTSLFDRQKTAIYMAGYNNREKSTTPYYYDHAITGNALADMKRIIGEKGGIWLHVGTHVDNAFSSNGSYTDQGSTTTLYASRVELRFVCTMPRFNY